jgi:hypothetical protein
MPADGIARCRSKKDLGTSRWQLSSKCYTTCPRARKGSIDVAFWHNVVDQKCKQFLVEPVGESIFIAAPFRGEPNLRYEEQNRLAARGRIFERLHPALAGDDAAFWIEIEEDVLLAAQSDSPCAESRWADRRYRCE